MAEVGGSRPCKQNRALGIRWRRDARLDIQIRRRRFGSTKDCAVGGGLPSPLMQLAPMNKEVGV